jgi:hypothetical protein
MKNTFLGWRRVAPAAGARHALAYRRGEPFALPLAPAEATLKFALPYGSAGARLNVRGGQPCQLKSPVASGVSRRASALLYLRLRGAVVAGGRSLLRPRRERAADNAQAACDWISKQVSSNCRGSASAAPRPLAPFRAADRRCALSCCLSFAPWSNGMAASWCGLNPDRHRLC